MKFLLLFNLFRLIFIKHGDIVMSPTRKIKYVSMQVNYADMQHNYSCMQLIFVNMQLLRWFIEIHLNSIYNIIKTHPNVIRSEVYRISLLFWHTILAFRHKIFCMFLTEICHHKHLYLKQIFFCSIIFAFESRSKNYVSMMKFKYIYRNCIKIRYLNHKVMFIYKISIKHS